MTCGRTLVPIVLGLCALPPVEAREAGQREAPPQPTVFSGQAAAQPTTVRTDSRAIAQGFSVVLVLADLQATSTQDDVPPAARRALADMKDFLPYKSYKLLDAAWILGHGATGTATRLRGPDDQDYELRMHTSRTSGLSQGTPAPGSGSNAVFVRFTLTEASRRDSEAEIAVVLEREQEQAARERQQRLARLEAELRSVEKQHETSKSETSKNHDARIRSLQAEIAALRNQVGLHRRLTPTRSPVKPGSRSGTIIDTSFTMDVGETVVVGTSRLRHNSSALIALLTAVPSRSSAR